MTSDLRGAHRPSRPSRFSRRRSDVFGESSRGEFRGIQIGPRIRVGGTLGKIGQDVKIGAGKVLSNPLVDAGLTFIPGVGPGIAAAAGGLGKALDTSHGSVGVGDIAKGALTGYAAGTAGQALKGGLSAVKGAYDVGGMAGAGKMALSKLTGAPMPGGAPGAAPGGGGGGLLGKVAGFLGDNALPLGVGAMGAAQVGMERNEADKLTNRGIDSAHQAYDAKAPLRQMALSQLMNTQAPDLTGRFSTGAVNPYAKKLPMSAVRGGM